MAGQRIAPIGELLAAWAEAWRPRPRVERAAWCAQHLRLPADASASPGRFDLRRYAYCRGVLEAADDPTVETIVLVWGTQLGKTTVGLAILLSQAALAPAPAMLVLPDKDELLSVRETLYAIASATVPLRDHLPPKRMRNDRTVEIGRQRSWLAYPYNTQRLSGKSAALVVLCEVDRYRARRQQGDPIQLARERTKAFFHAKIVAESSPSDEQSRIWQLWERSDQRQYVVPCPECGHYQALRLHAHAAGEFAGRGGIAPLRDSEGRWRTPDQMRESAWYVCERGCTITDEHKPAMVASGQWVARGQTLDARGRLVGDPERGPRVWGGQLNSLYAEPISFGRYAAEWLEARDDPQRLQVWTNTWEARPWKHKPATPRWEEVGRRLRGGHPRGSVPPSAVFLTAGCDPGQDYVRWVVRAWGEGSTSWLVDWGTTHKHVAPDGSLSRTSHLDQLASEVLRREWPVAGGQNVLGASRLVVRLAGIDCGYKPRLVHSFARQQPGQRVYTVAGRDTLKGGEFYRCSLVQKDARSGKPYPGGLRLWLLNRGLYNADLHERWGAPLNEAGGWWLTDAPLAQCEQYLRELVNEAPMSEHNRFGRTTVVWKKVEPTVGNHSWDAEVIALAMADLVTAGDWDNLAGRAQRAGAGGERVVAMGSRRPDGRPWIS